MTVADELATVLDLLDGLATTTEASQAVTMRDDGPCCHFVVHSRSWHAELKRADTPKFTADTMSRSCVTSANPSPNRAPAQEGGSTGWDRRYEPPRSRPPQRALGRADRWRGWDHRPAHRGSASSLRRATSTDQRPTSAGPEPPTTTIDGLLGALTDEKVVSVLADLAGVEAVVVPQLASLDFTTGPAVGDLLSRGGLMPVEEAGPSHGANLVANPTLDLRDDPDRQEQVDGRLQQVALDAGLRGMEDLLIEYHRT